MRTLLPILHGWATEGQRTALCTVVAVHGRAPLPVGSSLAVSEDGRSAGAVSGGCVERRVIEVAQAVLRGAPARRLRFAPGGDPLGGSALPCGGGIDVWVQPWAAPGADEDTDAFAADVVRGADAAFGFLVGPVEQRDHLEPTEGIASAGGPFALRVPAIGRLVLVGAGPVAGALCRLAPGLGMRGIVIDPREDIAAHAPIADASELLLSWPGDALDRLAPLGPSDALIALSHQPAIDDVALAAALRSGAGFVGAMGSRAAHAERLQRLAERGVSAAALAGLVGPVGLDLGGWSADEVALSIAAELVAVRNGRSGGRLVHGAGAIHGPTYEPATPATAQPQPATASPISAVILAAGAGRRFGGAKQAARWDGQTLVERAVRAAAAGLPEGSDIVVVVGAHEATVRAALPSDVPHRVVTASDWEEGLGASLRAGLAAASGRHAMVLLADQPLVDGPLVARVVRKGMPVLEMGGAAARPIVDGRPGHPVLLGPIALTRAPDLAGDRGLAPLLDGLHVHEIAVRERAAVIDVDQPADLLRAAPPTRPAPRGGRAIVPRQQGRTGAPSGTPAPASGTPAPTKPPAPGTPWT